MDSQRENRGKGKKMTNNKTETEKKVFSIKPQTECLAKKPKCYFRTIIVRKI